MKDFLSRNKFVLLMSLISVIVIVAFVYIIGLAQAKLKDSEGELLSLKMRVAKINNYMPTPTRENAELLKSDIAVLQKKLFEFENVFGNIYAKPLLVYATSLKASEILNLENQINELTLSGKNPGILEAKKKRLSHLHEISDVDFELEFIQNWNSYIANIKNSKHDNFSVDDLFDQFRQQNGYDVDQYKRAMSAFITEFRKRNRDDISMQMENEYLLAALGVPLDFNKIKCKTLITDIETDINNRLKENGIKVAEGKLTLFEEIPNLPEDSQVSRIVDYTRFLDDFYYRLSNSKVSTLISYKKLNGIMGQDNNGFLTFKYEVVIIGNLSSIRAFLNSLQNAYQDDRVYIIKSLSLSDENRQAFQALNKETNNSSKIERKIKVLFGDKSNELIRATIVVDYIIYKQKLAML